MQEKYAKLLIRKCINCNKPLFISCPIECYEFSNLLIKEAKKIGIKDIYVDYGINNVNFLYDLYALKKASFLLLNSNKKINSKIFKYYQNNNRIIWVIANVATKSWANKLYPNIKNNLDKCWNLIYKSCFIDKFNPYLEWNKLINKLNKQCNFMNDNNFDYIYFKNKLGTNIKIYLPKDHKWLGGDEIMNNIKVISNMPTYEIYTSPLKYKTEGIIYNSKPLIYKNKIIDRFYLVFKNGRVIKYHAKIGNKYLKEIINKHNGNYLGEIALVDNFKDDIYYNSLLDENSSCHIALGNSYKDCCKHKYLINKSPIHIDIMFGSKDLKIIGVKNNKEIDINVFNLNN